MTNPKKPAGFNLANPVPLTKWEAQRIQMMAALDVVRRVIKQQMRRP